MLEKGVIGVRPLPWERIYVPRSILMSHVHGTDRLCIVLHGTFEEEVGDGWRSHKAGTLLYRPNGHAHQERFGPAGAACAVFELDSNLMETLTDAGFDSRAPAAVPPVPHIASALRREARLCDAFSPVACQSLIWESLALLGRLRSARGKTLEIATTARELVEAIFCERTSLCSVARTLAVSPATLARAFSRHFRMSVGEFVRHCRIEKAAALLSGTSMPLAQVALECGFSSQAHLTATFRAVRGITPARYRLGSNLSQS